MAETKRPSTLDELFSTGYAFDFFQAIRLLERREGVEPVGSDGQPGKEAVQFRVALGHAFPASNISDLKAPTAERPTPQMTVNFFGLTGPSGVMPRHYTDMLMRLERDSRNPERHALRDWFDLFNHRLISLFYRAWSKYRFYTAHERREYEQVNPDAFTKTLLSLLGLGQPALRNRLALRAPADPDAWDQRDTLIAGIPDLAMFRYAGLLARRPRNVLGLEAMLSDYFQVPVEVQQFHGAWLSLDDLDRSQLGAENGNCGLGQSLVIGERVWDVEGRILLRIGPLTYEQFVELLPDESPKPARKGFFLLTHMARFYVGPSIEFDVRLELQPQAAPECSLGGLGEPGSRLGWNSWLVSESPPHVVADAVFSTREVFQLRGAA
ncbi:MAG: type VI secretion system baseplate subunit TssG [Planctomycetia bacterium]|nr:type VI secretion system baseplate subunit TssG [Planctomycetia bacterium]